MRKAIVNPADLRMVVGRGTVAKLAPGAALAVNASYFDPATFATWANVSLDGKVIGQTDRPHPYLCVVAGKAMFGRGSPQGDFCAGAGPMLLEKGQRGVIRPGENYGSDIVPGGEIIKAKRMAVGRRPDGFLVFITLEGTFGDLRREFLEAGCTDAMNLDGGSSTQWVEHGRLVEGSPRTVVNALVASAFVGVTPRMKVFVDRSEQWANTALADAYGGRLRYVEGAVMQMYGWRLATELESRGYDVRLSDSEEDNLSAIAGAANAWDADLVLSLHSDANDAQLRGATPYILATGGRAEKLAKIITAKLNGRAPKVKDFAILRETDAPAVLVELDFHTTPAGFLTLLSPENVIQTAEALADAVDTYRKSL